MLFDLIYALAGKVGQTDHTWTGALQVGKVGSSGFARVACPDGTRKYSAFAAADFKAVRDQGIQAQDEAWMKWAQEASDLELSEAVTLCWEQRHKSAGHKKEIDDLMRIFFKEESVRKARSRLAA